MDLAHDTRDWRLTEVTGQNSLHYRSEVWQIRAGACFERLLRKCFLELTCFSWKCRQNVVRLLHLKAATRLHPLRCPARPQVTEYHRATPTWRHRQPRKRKLLTTKRALAFHILFQCLNLQNYHLQHYPMRMSQIVMKTTTDVKCAG